MKRQFGKNFVVYLVLIAAVIAGLVAFKILVFTALAIIGGFVGGIVGAAVLASVCPLFKEEEFKSSSSSGQPVGQEASVVKPAVSTVEPSLERVIRLLLDCKLKGAAPAILTQLEDMIDRLFEILPRLNENHPGTELTHVVNKISGEYLHQIVGAYAGLSQEGRATQEAELAKVLRGLNAEIVEIQELVESQKVSDFRTHAKFIRTKFFGETIEAVQ